MGIFDWLLGKNEVETKTPLANDRNKEYEKQLDKNFGLRFLGNGWSFNGNVNKDFVAQLSDPALCLAVLGALRKQLHFDQVCIVSGKPVTLVCGSAQPMCLVTGLDATGIADLISTVIKANGRQVYEYQGAWLLRLS